MSQQFEEHSNLDHSDQSNDQSNDQSIENVTHFRHQLLNQEHIPITQSTYQTIHQCVDGERGDDPAIIAIPVESIDRSFNQLISTPYHGPDSTNQSILTPYLGAQASIDQSNNQSNNKSNDPSTNHIPNQDLDVPHLNLNESSTNQSINHFRSPPSFNIPRKLSINRSFNQSTNQSPPQFYGILPPPTPHHMPSLSQLDRSSINQSINPLSPPLSSRNVSVNQSTNQSNNQSINRLTRRPVKATRRGSVSQHVNPSLDRSANLPLHQLTKSNHFQTYQSIKRLIIQSFASLFSPSPHRQTFSRRFDQMIHSTISFLIVCILAIQDWSMTILAVPYLAVIYACISSRQSIGQSVMNIEAQIKGVLLATLIDTILLLAGLDTLTGKYLILAVVLILFVTSLFVSYYVSSILARRFALAMHALTMVQIATAGHVPDQFSTQILFNMVLGFTVSFVVSLFPFPRLAQDELLDRYQLSLKSLSKTFSTIVRAYLSTEPIAPHLLQGDAKSELEQLFVSISEMRRLSNEQVYECRIWQMCFPWSISLGSIVVPDIDRTEQLYWLLSNLSHTLATLRYSSYHAAFVQFLREGFVEFDYAQHDYLTLLGTTNSIDLSIESINHKKSVLECAMTQIDDAYLLARRYVYGYTADMIKSSLKNEKFKQFLDEQSMFDPSHKRVKAHPTKRSDKLSKDQSDNQLNTQQNNQANNRVLASSEIELAQTDHALQDQFYNSHRSNNHPSYNQPNQNSPSPLRESPLQTSFQANNQSHNQSINQFDMKSDRLPDQVKKSSPPKSIQLFHSTQEVFVRSSFLFYVQQFHSIIQQLKLDPKQSFIQSTNQTNNQTNRRSYRKPHKPTRRMFYRHKFRALKQLWTDNASKPLSWSLFGMHPVTDSFFLITQFVKFVRHPSIDWLWFRASFKTAFAIAAASLISIVPGDNEILPNSVWLVFTTAIIQSESEGALIQRGMDRLFGTLIGGLIGYLILLAFPHSWVGAIGLMCLWNMPCQFVQASPRYAYLGALATFSSIVVVFGYRLTNSHDSSVEQYTLSRMLEICLGVFVAVIISSVIYPISSIHLLRSEVGISITAMKLAIEHTRDIYDRLITKQQKDSLIKQSNNQTIEPNDQTIKPNAMSTIRSENENTDDDETSQRAYQNNQLTVNQSTLNPSSINQPNSQQHETIQINEAIMVEVNEAPESGIPRSINQSPDLSSADLLAQLLSDSACVQMSLSRQQRLRGEAIYEPAALFHKFPASQYDEIATIIRRLWRLILTLEPALRAVSSAIETLPLSHYSYSLRTMLRDIDTVLVESSEVLHNGVKCDRWDFQSLTLTAQVIQAEFAHSMNEMAMQVRSGILPLTPTHLIVPNAVFLHATLETSQLVLILEQAIRRLMMIERAEGYDD